MAYGTKYRLQFNEVRRGTQKSIDIMEKDYTSTVTEVKGTGDPVRIRYMDGAGGRDPVFESIKKSQAIINIMNTSNFQYQDMFVSATSRDYFIAIYSGDKSSEIVSNRTFVGSLESWTPSAQFIWDKDTATIDATTSDGTLEQTISFPHSGTYKIKVKYADANGSAPENISIVYDPGTPATILDDDVVYYGEIDDTFVVSAGQTSGKLTLTKSWLGPSVTSNIRILEISILAVADSLHEYNLIWKGWHQPQVYNESYLEVPYPTQLIASCGLNSLQNITFTEDWKYYSLLQVVTECVDLMGVYLPIKINVNLFDTDTMTDGDDPFANLYCQYYNFYNEGDVDDCMTVLEVILKPFGARMYQCDGHWVIERIANKVGTYYAYLYDWIGNELDDSLACNDSLVLTNNTASDSTLAVFTGRSQFMELEESWKNVKLVQTTGKKSIIYGDFSEPFWEADTTLYFWNILGEPIIERNGNALRYTGFVLNHAPGGAVKYDSYEYTTTDYDFGNHSGKFSFNYRWYMGATAASLVVTIRMLVYFQTGTTYYFLQKDDNDPSKGVWVDGSISSPLFLDFELIKQKANEPTPWQEIELDITSATRTGRLWVTLYPASNTIVAIPTSYYEIKDINYDLSVFQPWVNTDDNSQILTDEEINTDNFTTPDDIEFRLGDLQTNIFTMGNDNSTNGAYMGGLVNSSFKCTGASWGEWGEFGRWDLIHYILKNDMINQYKYNKQVLNATVFGGNVTFDSALLDTGNSSRVYLCKTLDISLRHQTAVGVWAELYQVGLDTDTKAGEYEGDEFKNDEYLTD